jgi:hypothetical protein
VTAAVQTWPRCRGPVCDRSRIWETRLIHKIPLREVLLRPTIL